MSRPHTYPTTQEEEDMALALAISASLTEGRAAVPTPVAPSSKSRAGGSILQVPTSRTNGSARPVAPSIQHVPASAPSMHNPAAPQRTQPAPKTTYPNSHQSGTPSTYTNPIMNGSGYAQPFGWPPKHNTPQTPIMYPNGIGPTNQATGWTPVNQLHGVGLPLSSSNPRPAPLPTFPTASSPQMPQPTTTDIRSTSAPPRRPNPNPWSPSPPVNPGVMHLPPQRSMSPPPRSRQPAAPSQTPSQAPPSKRLHPTGCAGCGKSLYGPYINALGRRWHAECFTCGFCSNPIGFGGNIEFAVGRDDNWPYHLDCHRHKYHPVCHVCQTFIPERLDGKIEFKENPFWREKYCPHHQSDGTPQCCACSRFKSQADAEWVDLHDARQLCLECLGSMLVDTKDAQPLYSEVMDFFRQMNMALPEKPPLFLVDGHVLKEYASKEGGRADGPIFHVRGLTLADIYRSIPTIRRVGGRNWFDVDSVSSSVVRTKCVVTGVLIMYGLPRLLTGCIMAHELMHAWLRMAGVTGLDLQVEEGLCQLMALLWLDRQGGPGSKEDPVQERLASFFAFQIRSDPSLVYGEGFRDAFEAFQKHQGDLKRIVKSVISTGRLPA